MRNSTPYLAALVITLPLFMQAILPSSAVLDILLSSALWYMIVVGAYVLGMVSWIKGSTANITDPGAKRVLTTKLAAGGVILGICIGFAAFSYHEIRSGEARAKIQHHGARTMAKVLDIYQDNCDKHGCGLVAKYQFTPGGGAAVPAVTGVAYLTDDRHQDNPHLLYAQANHQIPVAYEIANPANSAANFADAIFLVDPMKDSFMGIEVVGALMGFFFIYVLAIVVVGAKSKAIRSPGRAQKFIR